jgi:putative MATE family efflux protein
MSGGEGDRPTSPNGRARRSLTEGSVFGHLLRFILPMSVALGTMMAVGLINAFWLGKLSTDALAAISFAIPIMFLVMSVSIGLGAGTVAALSRVAASGDYDRIQRMAADAIILSTALVIVVSIIGALAARPIFSLVGAEGRVLDLVTEFAVIWFLGNVFVVVPIVANAMLRAVGEAVLPSLLMSIAAIVNAVLDPIFIFGWGPVPRLEVAGAAWATVLANVVAASAVMWVVIVRERLLSLKPRSWPVLLRHSREILKVGVPAMASNMLNPLALTLVVASLARFGTEVVAGYGAAARIESFAVIPLFALSAAIGPVAGQNNGAQRPDRVREAFRSSFLIALGWSLALAGVLAVAAPFVAPLFTKDAGAQDALRSYLWITPISVWGYGFVIVAAAGFNGVSRPAPALAMTFLRSIVLVATGAWVGGTIGGPAGAFVGVAAANVIAGVLAGTWTMVRAFPRPTPALLDAAPADR